MPQVTLSAGTLRYHEHGSGPPVVLVHGLLVNASLWHEVVPPLARHFRVVAPELPFGSHPEPVRPDTDLSPSGLAALVAEFLAALNLTDVTLVGNDTGGAICQVVAADHPERLARLVLTNCDAYDNFLPPAFRYLQWLARIPGGVWVLAQNLRFSMLRRLPIGYGGLSARPVPRAIEESWCTPLRTNAGIRHDAAKALRGIHPRYTLDAVRKLRHFDRPVLLAWGQDDPFFPPTFAQRLARDLPHARLELMPNARTFVPIDAPHQLADLIVTAATGTADGQEHRQI